MIVAALASLVDSADTLDNRASAMETIRSYRECCIQCLILSNYTKPGLYTLETMFIYMESEFLVNQDDQVQSFLLVGNVARLALRMGLHRDSTKVGGNITPFQAEIRRRLWHHLLQLDLLTSFHIGLPGTVQAIDSDTLLPGNFQDEDFDEDSVILPQSRPYSEITPMSYSICKSRLCIVAGKVVALANRLLLSDYQTVKSLDRDLQMAYQKVPPVFLLDPTGPSITDSPATTIRRFSLAILFQKSRCMLHRKHLMRAEQDPEFIFSKQVSLEAAMELLRCQILVHDAVLPGGQLSRDRWFLSSLSMHDFLLAAMIVYLSLSYDEAGKASTPVGLAEDRQQRIDALERSRAIWNQKWTSSAESKKAAMVLGIMLKKVYAGSGTGLFSSHVPPSFGAAEERRMNGVSKLSLNGILCAPTINSGTNCSQIKHSFTARFSILSSPAYHWGLDQQKIQHRLLDLKHLYHLTSHQQKWSHLGRYLMCQLISTGYTFLFILWLGFWTWKCLVSVALILGKEMFDTQLRPQDIADHNWPDLMEEFTTGNDDYYNL